MLALKRKLMLLPTETIEEGVRIKSEYSGVPKTPPIIHSKVMKKEDYGYITFFQGKLMLEADEIGDGSAFGHFALNDDNKAGIRTATVLAVKDTHCAVLDRKSYQVIFLKISNNNFFF